MTPYDDARGVGRRCHGLAMVALHETHEGCRLLRMNRLSQINATTTRKRTNLALEHLRDAKEARDEKNTMLRTWRSRDGFMDGWKDAS